MSAEYVDLIVNHSFAAPPGLVYEAWLDPAVARRWLFATPQGEMQRVEIDPRVGGKFTVVERRDGTDAVHRGEYLELDPPRRLVFGFGVATGPDPPELSAVSVDIAALDSGGCLLTLTHRRVPTEQADKTRAGWSALLANLDDALGHAGRRSEQA